MKPVLQTKLHSDTVNGNCLRACLASLLELDIEAIPYFEDMGEEYWPEFRSWLQALGYNIAVYTHGAIPEGYSVALGYSVRGIYHSCIALDGKVVHDPHPSGAGLEGIERYWELFKVSES